MRKISTDALHPWNRPMWTDSLTPLHEQFGMTAIEARLGRWCFGGDGDDGDGGGGYGVDDDPGVSMTANEAEAAAAAGEAAAAAAAAEGASAAEQAAAEQDAIDDFTDMAAAADVDAEFTEAGPTTTQTTADQAQEAFDAVGDLSDYSTTDAAQAATDIATASVTDSVADLSDFDTDTVEEAIDQLNEVGEVSIGYNDLAGFTDDKGFGIGFGPNQNSFFDQKDAEIAESNAADAAALTSDLQSKGYDVSVTVGADGTYSFDGPDAESVAVGIAGNALGNVAKTGAYALSAMSTLANPLGSVALAAAADFLGLPQSSLFGPTFADQVVDTVKGAVAGQTPSASDFGPTDLVDDINNLDAKEGSLTDADFGLADETDAPPESLTDADFGLADETVAAPDPDVQDLMNEAAMEKAETDAIAQTDLFDTLVEDDVLQAQIDQLNLDEQIANEFQAGLAQQEDPTVTDTTGPTEGLAALDATDLEEAQDVEAAQNQDEIQDQIDQFTLDEQIANEFQAGLAQQEDPTVTDTTGPTEGLAALDATDLEETQDTLGAMMDDIQDDTGASVDETGTGVDGGDTEVIVDSQVGVDGTTGTDATTEEEYEGVPFTLYAEDFSTPERDLTPDGAFSYSAYDPTQDDFTVDQPFTGQGLASFDQSISDLDQTIGLPAPNNFMRPTFVPTANTDVPDVYGLQAQQIIDAGYQENPGYVRPVPNQLMAMSEGDLRGIYSLASDRDRPMIEKALSLKS